MQEHKLPDRPAKSAPQNISGGAGRGDRASQASSQRSERRRRRRMFWQPSSQAAQTLTQVGETGGLQVAEEED